MNRKVLLAVLIFCMGAFAYGDETNAMLEELGLFNGPEKPMQAASPMAKRSVPNDFLMIPDSTSDTVGMYDPFDGTYLGVLIDGSGIFTTPINAVLGPDGDVYVSDQSADSVFVFDMDGNYKYTYADASDGLDNVRGIDFRDGHLFVCTYLGFIAEFDGPHSRLPDFITGPGGYWDIVFLSDGTCIVNDSNSDQCNYHDTDGTLLYTLFSVDFPEQAQHDQLLPGEYLCASFSEYMIHDFEISGNIVESTPTGGSTRGVHRLGNGNLLVAESSGVYEYEPGTGNLVGQEFTGSSRFIEPTVIGPPPPLTVSPGKISAWFGGTATFKLNGGPDLAGRGYGLFGTVSGTTPGFPLPGGGVLPINWDWFTYLVYFLALAPSNPIVDGFIGKLDVDGMAEATLTLPGHCQLFDDILSNFAWTTNSPFEFQSNPVDLMILGAPPVPPSYAYDDGSSENSLGWTAGGESVWAHSFDSGVGDTLTTVSSTFGSATTTNGPANGDPCWIYVWDDPNNDGNPVDGVLIGTATGVVANTNTNTFSEYTLDAPTAVASKFFVACHVFQGVGIYAAPMDESTPYGGEAWFMGGATFDPNDLTTTAIYEMGSIGFPAYWLLRADND